MRVPRSIGGLCVEQGRPTELKCQSEVKSTKVHIAIYFNQYIACS
jgi:hypothetical protein